MEHLLTCNIASLRELTELGKVLAKAGNEPVAILDRNEVVAYLVPIGAVADITTTALGKEKLRSYLKNGLPKIAHVIEYLRNQ